MFSRYLNICIHFLAMKKTAWLERSGYFRNLWRQILVNKNWAYRLISSLNLYTICFGIYAKLWIILKLNYRPLNFTSYKAFLKNIKKGVELVSLPYFLYDFWKNMFLLLYFINWPNFIIWFIYFVGPQILNLTLFF